MTRMGIKIRITRTGTIRGMVRIIRARVMARTIRGSMGRNIRIRATASIIRDPTVPATSSSITSNITSSIISRRTVSRPGEER